MKHGWIALMLAVGTALTGTAQNAFDPAFGPDAIDFKQSRQLRNGKAEALDETAVRRTLGLEPAGANAEDRKWEAGKADAGAATTFEYVLVLKQPMVVGTIAVSPADFADNKGSRQGGELFYLKPGAPVPAGTDAAAWLKLEYQPAAPLVRFAVLPAGTKTQAFLFRDVRTGGTSRLPYWSFTRRGCSA
jgi:hypothetical protein